MIATNSSLTSHRNAEGGSAPPPVPTSESPDEHGGAPVRHMSDAARHDGVTDGAAIAHPGDRTYRDVRSRWLRIQVWCGLAAPVLLYMYANTTMAAGSIPLIVFGLAMPIMFCLAIHIALEGRFQSDARFARAAHIGLTLMVVACTALWSWVHLVSLGEALGMGWWTAVTLPVVAESVLVSSLLVMHRERRIRWELAQHDAEQVIRERAAVEQGRRLALAAAEIDDLGDEFSLIVEQDGQVTRLYQLISLDDEPLYVGITGDLGARLRRHRATKEWFDQCSTMVVLSFPTRSQALAAEAALIDTLNPRYNVIEGALSDGLARDHGSLAPGRRTVLNSAARPVPRIDELDAMSRDDLREEARRVDVPVRGSRDELIKRVRTARMASDVPHGAEDAVADGAATTTGST